MSEKRLSEYERRLEVCRTVRERDEVCQADDVIALAQVPHGGALAVHEIIPRAHWRAGYLDPANCVLLCTRHHSWVHSHPYAAHALGLLKWSYERPDGKTRTWNERTGRA